MNRAIISQRITSILAEIERLNNALYAMNTTDIQRYPDNYEVLSTDAALRAERITCRLKRQETHRIFDRFWREQGWTRSAAYRWLAQNLHLKEHETHIGMMEMDECEQVIRLCRKYGKHKKEAA